MCEVKIDKKGAVMVTGSLGMADIDTLYEALAGVFNDGVCTVIDLTGVTEVSTPALQILAAFSKALADINRPVECLTGSAVDEALKLSGIKRLIKVA
jgi:anti-anti-sigma regulatory factor